MTKSSFKLTSQNASKFALNTEARERNVTKKMSLCKWHLSLGGELAGGCELHYCLSLCRSTLCQAHNKAPSLCTGIADYAKPANETSAAEYICTSVCIYIYLKLGNSMQLKQVIALIDKISNNCGGFTVFGSLFFQCCHTHTPKPMPFLPLTYFAFFPSEFSCARLNRSLNLSPLGHRSGLQN